MSTHLDEKYGPIIEGFRLEHIETQRKPKSLQKLDDTSGPFLKDYFSFAESGISLVRVNHIAMPILWVLDAEGEIWFSMEEVFLLYSAQYMYPLARAAKIPDGSVKLGHPSLVGGNGARIGGEIQFDPGFNEKGSWVISNRSGRFGWPSHRSEAHLLAVKDRFEEYDISLETYYLRPEDLNP